MDIRTFKKYKMGETIYIVGDHKAYVLVSDYRHMESKLTENTKILVADRSEYQRPSFLSRQVAIKDLRTVAYNSIEDFNIGDKVMSLHFMEGIVTGFEFENNLIIVKSLQDSAKDRKRYAYAPEELVKVHVLELEHNLIYKSKQLPYPCKFIYDDKHKCYRILILKPHSSIVTSLGIYKSTIEEETLVREALRYIGSNEDV